MRFFKVLCVIALAVCLTGIVYAETQSVKISGDLAIRSFMRGDYDLDKNHAETAVTRTGGQDDWQTFLMSTTEVQIDADLTDNVAAVVRLFNQRDWGTRTKAIAAATNTTAGYTMNADEMQIGVDLGYIELEEFLYSPLTLRIGRQDLWFGKGFIVGASFRDYTGAITANEYTAMTSFDAIRGTLDYDPWTVDLVYSKIWENAVGSNDDEDLYGLNVGYLFDVYNAEAEAYWFVKRDLSVESWGLTSGAGNDNSVQTIGTRGSFVPVENITAAVESAYQFGEFIGSRQQQVTRRRSAWALDASVESTHFQDYAWKPTIAVEYVFYYGHEKVQNEDATSDCTYTGWDMMYRGKFNSAIREFMGVFYLTNQDVNNQNTALNPRYPDAANTNQHLVAVTTTLQPTDSLTVDATYINFWQQYATYHYDPARSGTEANARVKDKKYLGSEVDLTFTWDYTEDVSFGLLTAWFFPGSHYYDQSDDVATDIVGSVKLSF